MGKKKCRREIPKGHPNQGTKPICEKCSDAWYNPDTPGEAPPLSTVWRYWPSHFEHNKWVWSEQVGLAILKTQYDSRKTGKHPKFPPITYVQKMVIVSSYGQDGKFKSVEVPIEDVRNEIGLIRRRLPIHQRNP